MVGAGVAAMAAVLGAFALVALARNGKSRDEFLGFDRFALRALRFRGLVRCPDNLLKTMVTALAVKFE
jgi:hypothetical protein